MIDMDKGTSDYLVSRIRELSIVIEPVPTGLKSFLPKLSGIRTVLFDVYGTLLVSGAGDIGISAEGSRADAMLYALTCSGFRIIDNTAAQIASSLLQDEIKKSHSQIKSKGIDYPEVEIREVFYKVIGELIGQNLIYGRDDNFTIERLAIEYECRVNPVWKMPGSDEIIKSLLQKDTILGIVSNAQFYTPLTLKAIFGKEPEMMGFRKDLIVWSYILGEAKPSIVPFSIVLERLQSVYGITPAECLYVGNSFANDILPPASLGFRTAHFAGDKRSYRGKSGSDTAIAINPDAVIINLTEIDDIVS